MYTTQLDNGALNNYAVEPKVYLADYPAVYEQRRYIVQGAIAALIVTAMQIIRIAIADNDNCDRIILIYSVSFNLYIGKMVSE